MSKSISPAKWRSNEKLTLGEAAARVGVAGQNPARSWQRWETGEREPPVSVIANLESISGGAVKAESWAEVRRQRISAALAAASDSKAGHSAGHSRNPISGNAQGPSPGQRKVDA